MKHILIDCDPGVDDAIAILYALRSPHLHVEGITTGFGNIDAAQGTDNALRLIRLANPGYEIPVATGAELPLSGIPQVSPHHIHGGNGMGDVELPPSDQQPLAEPAQEFIVRKANELNGDLVIVTLGRMTNLARALELDPRLPYKVRQVVSMGGNLRSPGNFTPWAEANIYGDALAADIVLKAGFHLTLVGLDVTHQTFLRQSDLATLASYCCEADRPLADFMSQVNQLYYRFHYERMGMMDQSVVHDPLAMILTTHPHLGLYRAIRAGVEHENETYRGMIKIDERFSSEADGPEIYFCDQVDGAQAVRTLMAAFR